MSKEAAASPAAASSFSGLPRLSRAAAWTYGEGTTETLLSSDMVTRSVDEPDSTIIAMPCSVVARRTPVTWAWPPEGTGSRTAAKEASRPLVPIIIMGTRSSTDPPTPSPTVTMVLS